MADALTPTYQLYGESAEWPLDPIHCESIAERSALHNWEIQPHRHAEMVHVFFLRQGDTRVNLDGVEHALTPPCLLIIPARTVHSFSFGRNIEGHVVTLHETMLDEYLSAAPGLYDALRRPRILPATTDGDGPPVHRLFDRLSLEFSSTQPARLLSLNAQLGMILVWIARAIDADARPDANSRTARRVADFQAMVEAHYREGETLDFYASRLGITPAQLNNICRTTLGKTAKRVVHDRVYLEARRNLIYTVMTVNEIAMLLGFADPAYFTRFFSRRARMSPSEFRRRSLGLGQAASRAFKSTLASANRAGSTIAASATSFLP